MATKKILVIDDDHLVAKSLSKLLETAGYNIESAESCNKALELIEQIDFNLIILDIKMPEVNGIKTAQNIRSSLQKKNKSLIPIIFITGYADESSYNDAKKLKAADFIYKPFDKEKFLQSIANALGR
jgi:CheY-like chemotaxis protein